MDIYISQLDETEKILPILDKYNVGLEIVQFASPYILDNIEKFLEEYKLDIASVSENIKFSIHGPYSDLIPGSRDRIIREATHYRFTQAYNVAKELNANKIIYHNGYAPNTYYKDEWLKNSVEFWKEFIKGKDDNIEIHIENVLEEDCILMRKLIDEIDNEKISICLDIGHVNAYSKVSVKRWIENLGNRIKHIHIHNNYSDQDSHSGIDKGNMNILGILEYIKRDLPTVSIALEIVDIKELKDSLEILENRKLIKKNY